MTISKSIFPGFDHYFSLGVNCEGAFQIRRVLGRDSSCFFSWNVTDFLSLQAILENNFLGVCEFANLDYPENGLIRDRSYDYKFHFPANLNWTGTEGGREFSQLRDKMMYLARKFTQIAESGRPTAYFYRTEEPTDVREKALRVVDALMRYHATGNFKLIVLQAESRREADWDEPNLANRYLARFAPWSDATDGHVRSWDRVFSEFPHSVYPLRLAGFDQLSNPSAETDNFA